jgi:hypothetical protein
MRSKDLTLPDGSKVRLDDDGQRFCVTVLETQAINVPTNQRMHLMDYKQFDIPAVSNGVVDAIWAALDKLPKNLKRSTRMKQVHARRRAANAELLRDEQEGAQGDGHE